MLDFPVRLRPGGRDSRSPRARRRNGARSLSEQDLLPPRRSVASVLIAASVKGPEVTGRCRVIVTWEFSDRVCRTCSSYATRRRQVIVSSRPRALMPTLQRGCAYACPSGVQKGPAHRSGEDSCGVVARSMTEFDAQLLDGAGVAVVGRRAPGPRVGSTRATVRLVRCNWRLSHRSATG